jgi:hypothetical protein
VVTSTALPNSLGKVPGPVSVYCLGKAYDATKLQRNTLEADTSIFRHCSQDIREQSMRQDWYRGALVESGLLGFSADSELASCLPT